MLVQAALAPALAAALLAAWLLVDPHTPDLAAQTYRVSLFREIGMAIWDEHWYAGHDLPGYSLLFPPLAALLGVQLTAVASVLVSTLCFERVAVAVYGAPARWAALPFALAVAADAWIGRLAFALGVAFATAAVLAYVRERAGVAALLAALCSAASPVAGVLLALAALTHAVLMRRPRSALALALPAAAVAGALAALFGEGGWEPFPLTSLLATLAVVAVFALALPPRQPLLLRGALVYAAVCLLCVAIPTPMGANVARYAVLLAGPLLVCAWAATRAPWPRRAAPALAAGLAVWGVWVAWGPVRETRAVLGNASTDAAYYAPVEGLFGGRPVRVEVPLTRSHWEAALLAPSVSLARGWEKQLDERYDRVLLRGGLTAASYERWLRANAVSYVALPDTPLDPSSAQEGRLIRGGLGYLQQVFASPHWRIYAVAGAAPLLEGPARLVSLGHNRVRLLAYAPGNLLLRVRYSRYLTLTLGDGCVSEAAGGWTEVHARAPGPLTLRALFSLSRALGDTEACRA